MPNDTNNPETYSTQSNKGTDISHKGTPNPSANESVQHPVDAEAQPPAMLDRWLEQDPKEDPFDGIALGFMSAQLENNQTN
ncbi:hypothetical protein PT974_09566 [Cladobotryum mycophilum]|uniref:Uncharacterized protein n=1 Tax=Cladobotryum mycophilum TaxID=491253 RepID=A0ABR0SGM1_9HYPO